MALPWRSPDSLEEVDFEQHPVWVHHQDVFSREQDDGDGDETYVRPLEKRDRAADVDSLYVRGTVSDRAGRVSECVFHCELEREDLRTREVSVTLVSLFFIEDSVSLGITIDAFTGYPTDEIAARLPMTYEIDVALPRGNRLRASGAILTSTIHEARKRIAARAN